jgi:hypothetical protein
MSTISRDDLTGNDELSVVSSLIHSTTSELCILNTLQERVRAIEIVVQRFVDSSNALGYHERRIMRAASIELFRFAVEKLSHNHNHNDSVSASTSDSANANASGKWSDTSRHDSQSSSRLQWLCVTMNGMLLQLLSRWSYVLVQPQSL